MALIYTMEVGNWTGLHPVQIDSLAKHLSAQPRSKAEESRAQVLQRRIWMTRDDWSIALSPLQGSRINLFEDGLAV
jgi:hypothetical protein